MELKDKALFAVEALKKEYPDALCSLDYTDPFRLLIATRLSAQCTDARVNLVTPVLFQKYPTIESLAQADVGEVETVIHSCGFFRQKAKDIVAAAGVISTVYGGVVPDTIEVLTTLPGVGRGTAKHPPAGGIQRLLPPQRPARPRCVRRQKTCLRALRAERDLRQRCLSSALRCGMEFR